MMESRTKNSIRNIFSGFLNRLVGIGIPFVMRTMLIKILGEQYLGLSSFLTSVLQVLNLAELGFGSAIVYSLYRPFAENDRKTICALLNLYRKIYRTIGVIILVVGLLVMPFLESFIKGGYPSDINIYVLYLVYLINTISSYILFAYKRCILEASQRIDILNNICSIVQLVFNLLKIVLLIILKNYYVYVFFIPIITILDNLIVARYVTKNYPDYICKGELKKSELKEIRKRVLALLVQKLGYTISNSLDSIIISSFLGLSVLATFSNYQYISNSVLNIVVMCYASLTASIGNSIVKETVERNELTFNKLVFLNSWIGCWCTVCLVSLYNHFITIWIGEKFILGMSTVILFALYFFISQTRRVITTYKDAAGIWWEDKFRPLIGCSANLFFNILLVKSIGVNGVILSTVISYLFIEYPWETHTLYKNYFHKSPFRYYISVSKYLMITTVTCFVTYLACSFFPSYGIMWFGIKMIICVILPNLILLLIFFKTKKFKDTADMIGLSRMFNTFISDWRFDVFIKRN